eukprot:10805810-Alexandrium_andersonii.AAC.1
MTDLEQEHMEAPRGAGGGSGLRAHSRRAQLPDGTPNKWPDLSQHIPPSIDAGSLIPVPVSPRTTGSSALGILMPRDK